MTGRVGSERTANRKTTDSERPLRGAVGYVALGVIMSRCTCITKLLSWCLLSGTRTQAGIRNRCEHEGDDGEAKCVEGDDAPMAWEHYSCRRVEHGAVVPIEKLYDKRKRYGQRQRTGDLVIVVARRLSRLWV